MRLNKVKTVALPYRAWSAATELLRLKLEKINIIDIGTLWYTAMFDIFMGRQMPLGFTSNSSKCSSGVPFRLIVRVLFKDNQLLCNR